MTQTLVKMWLKRREECGQCARPGLDTHSELRQASPPRQSQSDTQGMGRVVAAGRFCSSARNNTLAATVCLVCLHQAAVRSFISNSSWASIVARDHSPTGTTGKGSGPGKTRGTQSRASITGTTPALRAAYSSVLSHSPPALSVSASGCLALHGTSTSPASAKWPRSRITRTFAVPTPSSFVEPPPNPSAIAAAATCASSPVTPKSGCDASSIATDRLLLVAGHAFGVAPARAQSCATGQLGPMNPSGGV
mmetsp:Transcript_26104/g.60245  ORF Transcript_26104/g.60245 Transcript_26104/m.60245 type:complete len:250 (-) Transcript_26104:844-1593(-)